MSDQDLIRRGDAINAKAHIDGIGLSLMPVRWRRAIAAIPAAPPEQMSDAIAQAHLDGWAAAIEAAYARLCVGATVLENEGMETMADDYRFAASDLRALTPPADLAPLLAARDARVWEQALRDAASVAHEWQNETGTDIAAAARICPQVSDAILALIAKGGAE